MLPMADVVFQQDPQLGPEKFILRGTSLTIVGGVGLSRERTIRLADISPDFDRVERRLKRFYLLPVFLAVLSGAVSWALYVDEISYDVSMWKALGSGVAGLMALVFLLYIRFAPIEAALFRNTRGDLLFEVYRPLKAAYIYDDFVSELVHRIEACKPRGIGKTVESAEHEPTRQP